VSKYTGWGGEFRVENTGPVDLHVGIARGGIPEKPDMAAVAKGGIWIERILHDDPGATRTLSVVQPAGQNGGPEPFPGPVAEQAGSVARMVQGRSYVVELRIRCDREMKNVIIADMLCAGLEIENPRLNPDAIPALPNAQSPLQPSYLEIRDDRLVLACDSMPGATHVFYYTVRAVTPGRFQRPSATAECMYDSTIHSHTPASWVEIRK